MDQPNEQNEDNRDSDLEAFQEKILAKCQVYRSAKSKDDAKLSAIRQELEADFASKTPADINTVIESHKQELNDFATVAE